MEELEKIKLYVQGKDCVSVPQIQKDLGLPYRKVREAVSRLVESSILAPDGEMNFKPKEIKKPTVAHTRSRASNAHSINYLREKWSPRTSISQAEQNRVNRDCSDEKYAEFLEESKKNDTNKIKLVCRKKDGAYAKTIEDFNNLPAASQLILIDTMTSSSKVARYELYQLLREEGDCRLKYSNEYISYSVAMSFLLQISDSAFEVLKKRLKIK